MEVNLSEHIVTRLQIFLDGKDSPRSDENPIAVFVDLKRIDNPFEIVETYFAPVINESRKR